MQYCVVQTVDGITSEPKLISLKSQHYVNEFCKQLSSLCNPNQHIMVLKAVVNTKLNFTIYMQKLDITHCTCISCIPYLQPYAHTCTHTATQNITLPVRNSVVTMQEYNS